MSDSKQSKDSEGLAAVTAKLESANKHEEKTSGTMLKVEKHQTAALEKIDDRFKKFFDFLRKGDLQKAEDQREFLDLLNKLIESRANERDTRRHSPSPDLSGLRGLLDALNPFVAFGLGAVAAKVGAIVTALASAASAITGLAAGMSIGYLKARGIDVIAIGKRFGASLRSMTNSFLESAAKVLKPKVKPKQPSALSKTPLKLRATSMLEGGPAKGIVVLDAADDAKKATSMLSRAADALAKMRKDILSGVASFGKSLVNNQLTNAVSDLFKGVTGNALGTIGRFFGSMKNAFMSLFRIGANLGKIVAWVEAPIRVILGAFREFDANVTENTTLFENIGFALIGAGKAALKWFVELPGLIIDLTKDWIVAPIMSLFGADKLAEKFKSFSFAKLFGDAVDTLFGLMKYFGEWIVDRINGMTDEVVRVFNKTREFLGIEDKEKKAEELSKQYRMIAENSSPAEARQILSRRGYSDEDINIAGGKFARERQTSMARAEYHRAKRMEQTASENRDMESNAVVTLAPSSVMAPTTNITNTNMNTTVASSFIDSTLDNLRGAKFGYGF